MAEIYGLKINRAGARDVMKSAGVAADLEARGMRIAEAAEGMSQSGEALFDVKVKDLRVSTHVFVETTDAASMASNAKHNSLVRSIDAGRG